MLGLFFKRAGLCDALSADVDEYRERKSEKETHRMNLRIKIGSTLVILGMVIPGLALLGALGRTRERRRDGVREPSPGTRALRASNRQHG